MSSIHGRLIEFGRWLIEPRLSIAPSTTPLHRVKEDRENAGAGGSEFHYDMLDDVPCMPDGGVSEAVRRMGPELTRDRKCREIRELVWGMPVEYAQVLLVTYASPSWRDIPRREVEAAKMLRISVKMYRGRRERLFKWLDARLCYPNALAA